MNAVVSKIVQLANTVNKLCIEPSKRLGQTDFLFEIQPVTTKEAIRVLQLDTDVLLKIMLNIELTPALSKESNHTEKSP